MPIHLPTAAAPFALLTTLVSSPVCMRGPEHHALIRGLWQRHQHPQGAESRIDALSAAISLAGHHIQSAAPGQVSVPPWEDPLYVVEDGVAYLSINGPMIKGYDDFTAWYFECCSIDRVSRTLLEIERLAAVGQVRALVLCINSPGGSAMGTPELGAQLAALDERLPVFAYTSDLACSAAYWVMSSARLVFATPSAMVGSIGTYLAMYDYAEMLKEWGIKLEMFRAGSLKGIGVMGKEYTDEERAFLSGRVQRINAGFTGHVRAMRGDIADSTMQGQWFDGAEAVGLGLVDATVSGLPELVAAVAEEIG